jgi:hypothetical protein
MLYQSMTQSVGGLPAANVITRSIIHLLLQFMEDYDLRVSVRCPKLQNTYKPGGGGTAP